MIRLSALVLVTVLAGCQWEGRPDGGSAVHTGGVDQMGDLDPALREAEIIEPLDSEPIGPEAQAPVDLTQPPPTTGTADNTSEVEEALTPGTEL